MSLEDLERELETETNSVIEEAEEGALDCETNHAIGELRAEYQEDIDY